MADRRVIRAWLRITVVALSFNFAAVICAAAEKDAVLTGKAAMGDWTSNAPGVTRKITVQHLPPPSSNALAINSPHVVNRPADAQPKVPLGFKIDDQRRRRQDHLARELQVTQPSWLLGRARILPAKDKDCRAFDSVAPALSPCWASRLCRSAPFCETQVQNKLASGTDALQFGITAAHDACNA